MTDLPDFPLSEDLPDDSDLRAAMEAAGIHGVHVEGLMGHGYAPGHPVDLVVHTLVLGPLFRALAMVPVDIDATRRQAVKAFLYEVNAVGGSELRVAHDGDRRRVAFIVTEFEDDGAGLSDRVARAVGTVTGVAEVVVGPLLRVVFGGGDPEALGAAAASALEYGGPAAFVEELGAFTSVYRSTPN